MCQSLDSRYCMVIINMHFGFFVCLFVFNKASCSSLLSLLVQTDAVVLTTGPTNRYCRSICLKKWLLLLSC